jgi:type IV pilus assembly protein PilE
MCRDAQPHIRARSPPAQAGFTLIELMIVVVIVAILAVVVLPSYQSYVLKARRTDAKAALTSAAQMLERFSTESPTRGFSTATLGNAGVFPDRSENGYYALTLTNRSVSTYTLSATPQGAQVADACKTFILDHQGTRTVSADATRSAQECWQ